MAKKVRVRFAPSPTGPLHIGGVRTALFNYLFAKKHGGDFVLRIEDTDQNRYVEGAEAYIVDALEWCGMVIDEGPNTKGSAALGGSYGPYRQSERRDLYRQYALELVEKGHAYYAFDTPERLDHHRKNHEEKGKTFIYNWHNRLKLDNSLSMLPQEVEERLASGADHVIRFLTPPDQKLQLEDSIRGSIEIDTNVLDDKVLFKSDGMPTYHLANIVDDHLMDITHVIRGEEWLPSLALHHQLYAAFGWTPPTFAHLPLIMKPTGKGKLSKRDGEKGGFPVFPLSWKESQGYREAGYFPEAVVNFLALLGWNPGTEQELFSMEELIGAFGLDRVHKGGARFDPDKTKWYNHQYLQRKKTAALLPAFQEVLSAHGVPAEKQETAFLTTVVDLIKERANFVSDFWELGHYFFVSPEAYNDKAVKKQWKPDTAEHLRKVSEVLRATEPFAPEAAERAVKEYITDNGLSFGKIMGPLRLCVVGDLKGPHLFHILSLIGKEESVARIGKAMEKLA
ncbi:glutamate--tRNA ligase [Maribacter sp. 2307ULW6-5]|uniref:glutamate--tRNA ligase n=1 Tax=Maribacter sp. 2307ULW6-5 TaxID=3386275 RepID=UPI0039BD4BF6